jgi:hypothetical protein
MKKTVSSITIIQLAAGVAGCGVAVAGCAADTQGSVESVGKASSPLYVPSGISPWKGTGGKGNLVVPFCWEQPDNPDYQDFAAERAMSELQLKKTWQAVSGIRFNFEGWCPTSGTEQDIRVRQRGYINQSPTSSTKVEGTACLRSATQPGVPANDTMCSAFDYATTYNAATMRIERACDDSRVKYVAVHEMGHVLGFGHEQDRPDNPEQTVCPGGSYGGTYLSAYDHLSVMNYCSSTAYSGVLSPGDVQGVRKLYGWHSITDYNNDGIGDLALWRPASGQWFIADHTNGFVWGQYYGVSGDYPVRGDFDGDGQRDIAVYRPTGPYQGWWFILKSAGGELRTAWGAPGAVPVPGDYDGDGVTDLAYWLPSDGSWHIQASSGATMPIVYWGQSGDYPIVADFDGDGISDLAVFRPSGSNAGYWYVVPSSVHLQSSWNLKYGEAGDIPMVGDYDGDGRSDVAVWRPTGSYAGWWFIQYADGTELRTQYGQTGDIPVAADYNGDGVTDIAVFRANTAKDSAVWYVKDIETIQMGSVGDIPLARAYQ